MRPSGQFSILRDDYSGALPYDMRWGPGGMWLPWEPESRVKAERGTLQGCSPNSAGLGTIRQVLSFSLSRVVRLADLNPCLGPVKPPVWRSRVGMGGGDAGVGGCM